MLKTRRRHGRQKRGMGLNIIAFLNIMVILIPFLLVSAVFSRTNILELNIPPASSAALPDELKPDMQLVITIRQNSIDVGDTVGGLIKRISSGPEGHDYQALSQLLVQIKTRFPEKKNAAVLLEPQIPYDVLVQVMDATRSTLQVQAATLERAELFPDVSIGDAPVE